MQQTIKEFDSIKNENQIQIDNLTMLCSSKSEENKQLQKKECQKCHGYQEQLKLEQVKSLQLEKQMKKCAFMLNTSVEKEDTVLKKVRSFMSQSLLEKNETSTTNTTPGSKSEGLSTSDIIVPSTPEKVDSSLICAETASDGIYYVPETAPFDLDENGALIKSTLAKSSPISVRAGKNCASPIGLNDSMFYSPPVFARNVASKQLKDEQCDDDDDFQVASPRKKTLIASSAKKIKQIKLFPSETSRSTPHDSNVQAKTESFSPQFSLSPDIKKRKRVKGPEDWTCTDCIRMFKESNMDTKKMKPSMNFCPEHRNRFTYYLGTPPDFFNPKIVGSPRKGRKSSSQNSRTTTP